MEKIQCNLELSIGKRGWETKEIVKRLDLKNFPKIPSLCLCGCNETVWNGTEYSHGHHIGGDYKKTLLDKTWYPKIPSLCECGCNEIVYNGHEFIKGHQSRTEENRKKNSERQKGNNKKLFLLDECGNKQIFPKIPVICYCNKCNEICWTSNYKKGHQKILNTENIKIANKARIKTFLIDSEGNKEIYPPIFDLCWCGCNTIVYGGKRFVHGHFLILNPPVGINHGNYIDGRSYEPYCFKFNNPLKVSVRKRDEYICQMPGCLCTQYESLILYKQVLHVHHIHYDKQNCEPDLIALCPICNNKVNHNRSYWESLFMNLLNNRNLLLWTRSV